MKYRKISHINSHRPEHKAARIQWVKVRCERRLLVRVPAANTLVSAFQKHKP
jgi:hypothetical protein